MTAEQIYRQLINLGRQRNRPGEEMITLYGLERVLNRLTLTRFADDFSLTSVFHEGVSGWRH